MRFNAQRYCFRPVSWFFVVSLTKKHQALTKDVAGSACSCQRKRPRKRRQALRHPVTWLAPSTPAGWLMANILAGVAAFETEVRAERILAGQTAARKRGVRWGGSAGGRRIKVTSEQLASIQRLGLDGQRFAAIARAKVVHLVHPLRFLPGQGPSGKFQLWITRCALLPGRGPSGRLQL